jgi:DNA-directed RNA polymerase subunit RPC12/RpoP
MLYNLAMSGFSHEMLVCGIAAAKAGEVSEARSYLERVIERGDTSLDDKCDAWYWLSEISTDAAEQRSCLENILTSNLGDVRARRKMAILNGELNPDKIIDPDLVKQTVDIVQKAASGQHFVCPHCGGRMTFTSDGQSLVCEYCETAERMEHKTKGGPSKEEENFIAALATSKGHFKPLSTRLFICQSCSAKFFLLPEQMTLTCPYCKSPFIIDQAEKEDTIEPNSLIPFEISNEKATKIFHNWLKENVLIIEDRIIQICGVYLPAWAFDVGGVISWTCQVEKTVEDGISFNFNIQGREWKTEKGERIIYYNNLLIPASKRLPPKSVETILPCFDLTLLEAYDPHYLVDRTAEYYQIPLAEASLLARKTALEKERESIRANYFKEVRDLTLGTAKMVIEGYRLVLLPIWFARYNHKNQDYLCVLNGQSGTIWGEKPRNAIKKWLDKYFNR